MTELSQLPPTHNITMIRNLIMSVLLGKGNENELINFLTHIHRSPPYELIDGMIFVFLSVEIKRSNFFHLSSTYQVKKNRDCFSTAESGSLRYIEFKRNKQRQTKYSIFD